MSDERTVQYRGPDEPCVRERPAGVLASLTQYHGAGKPNPVLLAVPPHEPVRVPGLGQLVPVPMPRIPQWLQEAGGEEDVRYWVGPRQLTVCAGSARTDHGRLLHVSVSHPKQLPSWEEMSRLRDFFFGQGVDAAMILPRRSDWVNVHAFCFHLWQIPVEWGLH
jgi:hypothetical protein